MSFFTGEDRSARERGLSSDGGASELELIVTQSYEAAETLLPAMLENIRTAFRGGNKQIYFCKDESWRPDATAVKARLAERIRTETVLR